MDYTERLQRLAINDEHLSEDRVDEGRTDSLQLDPKTLALVRLASLIAVGGAVPSYGAEVNAALDAGATATEIVDVLFGVMPIVGLPCIVDAAPKVALALGYDTDDGL